MSTNIPAQPAAPDYSDSYKQGVYADIETLPARRQIDQAARLGGVVAEGQVYTPDQYQQRLQFEQDKLAKAQASGDQVSIDQANTALAQLNKASNFSGLGDIELAKQATKLATDTNADVQRQQLALRQELGVANAQQTSKEIEAADPLAYQTRQALTGKVLGDLNDPNNTIGPSAALDYAYNNFEGLAAAAPQADGRLASLYDAAGAVNPQMSDMGQLGVLQQLQAKVASDPGAAPALQALQRQAAMNTGGSTRQLGSIYDQATRLPENFSDSATAALNPALQSALSDYALGGKLNDAQLRDTTNNVRAGQVDRGNFLGDAAAVQEAVAQNASSDALKQQRLQNLLSVQNQVFGQSDALRNESTAAAQQKIATLSGLTGQQAQLAQAGRTEQAGYATGAADQTNTQTAQLAQLAQQIFGNGTQLQQQQFAQQLQQLGMLGNLAGQDFTQKQQAYTTQLNAAGQQMQGAQAVAADDRAARSETYARSQQELANASAMVLGQPITNQFGSLQGAQQGAVGFTPINYQSGAQLNANAGAGGANFAQQSFGTNANMWTTAANIAQQDNAGMMSAISGVGGMALGAMI